MPATDESVFSLHRYFIAANMHRTQFDEVRAKHTKAHGTAPTFGGEDWNESWIAMSYWYGGLYVVVEGWRELGLQDPKIDALLASPNVDLLKRYRNGVFHFQRRYFDDRLVELIRDGEDVVRWVRDLNMEFGRFFLEWFQARRDAKAAPLSLT